MSELSLLGIYFAGLIVGILFGFKWCQHIISNDMLDSPDRYLEVINRIKEINAMPDTEEENVVPIVVEQHYGVFYVFINQPF